MSLDPIGNRDEFFDIAMAAAPDELLFAVKEYWPEEDWGHACGIAQLESGFDAFALNDTTDDWHPCGAPIGIRNGVVVSAERSVGYFQINSCNFPDWEWQRLYNARHNAGTAHMLWDQAGKLWWPWFFSATRLGLI